MWKAESKMRRDRATRMLAIFLMDCNTFLKFYQRTAVLGWWLWSGSSSSRRKNSAKGTWLVWMMYSALMFGTRFKKNNCKYTYTVIHIAALTIDRLHSATLLALFMHCSNRMCLKMRYLWAHLTSYHGFPFSPSKFTCWGILKASCRLCFGRAMNCTVLYKWFGSCPNSSW